MNNPPKGTIKYCTGKDTPGSAKALIKEFNAKYGAQGSKATPDGVPDLRRPAARGSSSSASRRSPTTATSSAPT